MQYSSLTTRIGPQDDVSGDPWEVHSLAMQRVAQGENITLLSIGQEADEVTPSVVVDAAVESLRAGDHHYSDINGTEGLRSSIAKYHQKLTSQVVSPDACTVFAGAQNALYSVAQVLLEPGVQVILSEPYYTTYAATFSSSGAELVCVPVRRENHYQLDAADILDRVTDKTRLIVLNTPNNPMGSCYSAEQINVIAKHCIQHRIWLLMDTVYLDIVEAGAVALPHSLPGIESVLITVGSLSKSHRMTGWRVGWAVGPESLAEHVANLSLCMHYGLPPFIMQAAEVAINKAAETPQIVRSVLQRRRAIATEVLSVLPEGLMIDSGQGMFMLLDASQLPVDARGFALHLLENHRVSVLPCDGFGASGKQLVRIGLCVDDDKLKQACKDIVACINSLSQC